VRTHRRHAVGLRPATTTARPAARAALVISTPTPRPARVMSQTFLTLMCSSSSLVGARGDTRRGQGIGASGVHSGSGRQGVLTGRDGGFITGSDFPLDGGVTAAWCDGELAPQ
jgi:hypothetical protein